MGDLRDDLAREFFEALDRGPASDIWATCEAHADRALALIEAAGYRLAKCDVCGEVFDYELCRDCYRDA